MNKIKMMVGLIVVALAGMTLAAPITISAFTNNSVGGCTAVLSGASASGFAETMTVVTNGSKPKIVVQSNFAPVTLAVGDSIVMSFTFNSTQIKNSSAFASGDDLNFGWGFAAAAAALSADRGVLLSAVDVGGASGNFLRGYRSVGVSNAWNQTTRVLDYWNTKIPTSGNTFSAGNTVDIMTTYTKISDTGYTETILWGGNTYTNGSVITLGSGFAFDRVFFRSGYSVSAFDQGDNYTISGLSVQVIPEPATIGLMGSALVGLLLFRRYLTKK